MNLDEALSSDTQIKFRQRRGKQDRNREQKYQYIKIKTFRSLCPSSRHSFYTNPRMDESILCHMFDYVDSHSSRPLTYITTTFALMKCRYLLIYLDRLTFVQPNNQAPTTRLYQIGLVIQCVLDIDQVFILITSASINLHQGLAVTYFCCLIKYSVR